MPQVFNHKKNNIHSHKALRVPKLSIGVDNFFVRLEALATAGAKHVVQRHVNDSGNSVKKILQIIIITAWSMGYFMNKQICYNHSKSLIYK